MQIDQTFMQYALRLADQGAGYVAPNPLVGAVVVKNNKIIGSGYHERYGQAHAEINALNSCSQSPEGATLYTTLEPCCHLKKQTPPCVERIIKEKIKKVVIGSLDPNPNVSGNAIQLLKSYGIIVVVGVLEEEEKKLNKVYHYNVRTGLPYVHLKWAQTLDGKMATTTGDSKWITSEDCRMMGHDLRGRFGAIMVGKNTVLKDNPKLNIRFGLEERYQKIPIPIVLADPNTIPAHYEVRKNDQTIFFGKENLEEIIKKLAEKKITSFLVEGGPSLINSFLQKNLAQSASIFIAPKLLGDGKAPYSVFPFNKKVSEAKQLLHCETHVIGQEILIEAILKT